MDTEDEDEEDEGVGGLKRGVGGGAAGGDSSSDEENEEILMEKLWKNRQETTDFFHTYNSHRIPLIISPRLYRMKIDHIKNL